MKNFLLLLLVSTMLFSSEIEKKIKKKEVLLEKVQKKQPSIYKKLLSLDYLHYNITQKIHVFSNNLDNTIEGWVNNDNKISSKEVNKSINEEKEAYSLYSTVNQSNDFFKDENYLNTVSKSYIRLRWGVEQNTQEDFEVFNNYQINLRLPKTEESLYLYIGDDEDEDENTKTINEINENKTTSVGIKYILNNLDALNTSVFVGFRGITNPFIKLRIQYPIAFKYFLFRPVQYFEYSVEDTFKEETKFYFDYHLKNKKDLVRLSLGRYTQTDIKGMRYSTSLSYISTIKHNIGYQIYTSLKGQTKIQSTKPLNTKYNVTPHAGVYTYNTGAIWKQKFFKKYLFYELHPYIEHAQQYNFKPNYIFRANLELYFGDI